MKAEARGPMAASISRFCHTVERVRRLAEVRQRVAEALSDARFMRADLRQKSARVLLATDGFAPLRLVHWKALKGCGKLPRCHDAGGGEDVEDLLHRIAQQDDSTPEEVAPRLVPFFLSHRWLRAHGPRKGHHPDSLDSIKARQLVAFAEWFTSQSQAAGFRCEVAFWIDWCCAEQDHADISEVYSAALPLYIACCSKVVAWETPDFERRCWLLVERLLAYCFCAGGLKPFVINETSFEVDVSVKSVRSGGAVLADGRRLSEAEAAGDTTIIRDTWQVFKNGQWQDYSLSVQNRLFDARQKSLDKVVLHFTGQGGAGYEFDLVRMRQTNVLTRRVKNIRVHRTESVLTEAMRAALTPGADGAFLLGESRDAIGRTHSRKSTLSSMLVTRTATGPTAQPKCRPRKVSNPLDFESLRVARAADRRSIAFLVDATLSVPALEVFEDRQPVDFGLTEVLEQSLVNRTPLPDRWMGASDPPSLWLMPTLTEKSDWRIVVWNADAGAEEPGAETGDAHALEHADAQVWMDHVFFPIPRAWAPDEIGDRFDAVDRAVAAGSDRLAERSRALISALMSNLRHARASSREDLVEQAIALCRDVDLPDKRRALEFVCGLQLERALAADDTQGLRRAVGECSRVGCEYLETFARARTRQLQLAQIALADSLAGHLASAREARDVSVLLAVRRVAEDKRLTHIVDQAEAAADEFVEELKRGGKHVELEGLQRTAEDGGWPRLARRAAAAVEAQPLAEKLDGARARSDLGALRAVAKRARELELAALAESATAHAQEAARRINTEMGLPPSWDVVQEQHGWASKLLLKTEERDGDLVARIQQMVDSTFRGWGAERRPRTRDRPPGQLVAVWLEVKSVVHVQNAECYLNYKERRRKILSEMRDDDPPISAWDVRTDRTSLTGVGRFSDEPLDPRCNEVFLWHGTSPEGASGITDSEFDLRRARRSKRLMFGQGIYLAESCLKADEYTKHDRRGLYPMVLCRTALGRPNYCGETSPATRALEASCRPGGGYHSVLGDREAVHDTFREFIVYDKHQVYPEYIVWYARRWFSDS